MNWFDHELMSVMRSARRMPQLKQRKKKTGPGVMTDRTKAALASGQT
jgi:hypothetical protein